MTSEEVLGLIKFPMGLDYSPKHMIKYQARLWKGN